MANLKHLLGIQDQIVGREQALNRGSMNLHLGSTDADRPVADQAVTFLGFVGDFDAVDADRRDRIVVDRDLQAIGGAADIRRTPDRSAPGADGWESIMDGLRANRQGGHMAANVGEPGGPAFCPQTARLPSEVS